MRKVIVALWWQSGAEVDVETIARPLKSVLVLSVDGIVHRVDAGAAGRSCRCLRRHREWSAPPRPSSLSLPPSPMSRFCSSVPLRMSSSLYPTAFSNGVEVIHHTRPAHIGVQVICPAGGENRPRPNRSCRRHRHCKMPCRCRRHHRDGRDRGRRPGCHFRRGHAAHHRRGHRPADCAHRFP